ncbi:MAG TPA: sulfurtransferase [Cyclobacteriaceae bacterium]|nr:sulfurtransferase [Cyclobacteriaceae bacterium]
MKTLPVVLILFLCLATQLNAQPTAPVLVEVDWLKDHLKDPNLVILQTSFLKYEYDQEHIEGAVYLWPGWLAPDSPYGAMNAPDLKEATTLLRSFGITNQSQVVICHTRGDVSQAARMFLTLEHLGLRGKVSFLNGGLDAWKKAGNSVTQVVPVVKPGNFKASDNGLLVDRNYVLKTLKSGNGAVVDARAARFYDGEPVGNPRDGHIAGAKNIPFMDLIDQSTNKFKPVDQVTSYFVPVADKSKELVTYCFIGQTASVVYLAGRSLGYDMKLYDGSMQEWSRIPELPMETTKK